MTRGPKSGYCVICGTKGPLCKDHVPPKACDNFSDTELKPLQGNDRKMSISQGGTHFKTICGVCNSTRLGADYDPELVQLVNEIGATIKASAKGIIALPKTIRVEIKPQKIARAIIGHLLAANSIEHLHEPPVASDLDEPLREYFLNQELPFPEQFDLYYWPYPYRDQVVAKYLSKLDTSSRALLTFHVMKFPPLGFMLAYKKEEYSNLNLPLIIEEKRASFNNSKFLNVDLSIIPERHFPERPNGNEVILMNENQAFKAQQKI